MLLLTISLLPFSEGYIVSTGQTYLASLNDVCQRNGKWNFHPIYGSRSDCGPLLPKRTTCRTGLKECKIPSKIQVLMKQTCEHRFLHSDVRVYIYSIAIQSTDFYELSYSKPSFTTQRVKYYFILEKVFQSIEIFSH